MTNVLWFFGAVGTIGLGFTVVYRTVLRPARMLMSRTNDFLDDWFGVPDRPGVPGRPGVMVRLSDVELNKVNRTEFVALATEVASKASVAELLELRVALQRHITRTEDTGGHEDDVPHPREES